MKLTMQIVFSCYNAEEKQLSLNTLAQRLAQVLPHAPRATRLANFLHDVPSKFLDAPEAFNGLAVSPERVYQRWDIKEAADVEQADEERAKEKSVKVDRLTLQLRVPASVVSRLQALALARGVSLSALALDHLTRLTESQ